MALSDHPRLMNMSHLNISGRSDDSYQFRRRPRWPLSRLQSRLGSAKERPAHFMPPPTTERVCLVVPSDPGTANPDSIIAINASSKLRGSRDVCRFVVWRIESKSPIL